MAFLFPLIYCLIAGYSWSIVFKKKYRESLAPAFLLHALIVLLCGMLFHNLKLGVYGVIAGEGLIVLYHLIKKRNIKAEVVNLWNGGFFLFLILYLFCWFTNIGKEFYTWDEFSHWGMFLKESLRLNDLYATSPLTFSHKDYVPYITMFEVIWVKLCRRYMEADAYRGIQMFMFSLMLPIFAAIEDKITSVQREKPLGHSIVRYLYSYFPVFGGIILVLLMPIIFDKHNGFYFYHSIYCDYAAGVLLFYCLMTAAQNYNRHQYQVFVLTIGLTALVLAKMVMMAFLPMVIAFYIVKELWISGRKKSGTLYLGTLSLVTVPVGIWYAFNKFVDQYVDNVGSHQSYDGMNLQSILEVFTSPENSSILYLEKVRRSFITALFSQDILLHGSYVVVVAGLVIILFVFAHLQREKRKRKISFLLALWTLLAGAAYALLMYFLYCTAFTQSEAESLASYERYMNTFTVAAVLLVLYVYFDTEIWDRYRNGYYAIIVLVSFDLFFFHVSEFKEIVPGVLAHDEEANLNSKEGASIIDVIPEDSSVYEITRGENGQIRNELRYYCAPRSVEGGSIGQAIDENDVYTTNLSAEELVSEISTRDYLYLNDVDSDFILEYMDCFSDPSILTNKVLYKVNGLQDGKILMEYADFKSGKLSDVTVLEEYLQELKNSDYTVFFSIRDEGAQYMTDVRMTLLADLGIRTDLRNQIRKSYIGIIQDGDSIYEQLGDDLLTYSSTMENNVTYTVTSAGYDAAGGSASSIIIDGVEYSRNRRGLNIAVYSQKEGKVIDHVCFDTDLGGLCYRY